MTDRAYLSSFEMTRLFHKRMKLPVHYSPREPTMEERVLRAKLLLEECVETIEQGLGVEISIDLREIAKAGARSCGKFLVIRPDYRIPYDPIETLDGLADVKVIANGTAVQFGLPMSEADEEVFESNMSKLDENGEPIVNECVNELCYTVEHDCSTQGHLLDPSQPRGKILKGPNFRKPDIKAILEMACTGHVAASHDSQVCGNCGTHINELRP